MDLNVKNVDKKLQNVAQDVNKYGIAAEIVKLVIGQIIKLHANNKFKKLKYNKN